MSSSLLGGGGGGGNAASSSSLGTSMTSPNNARFKIVLLGEGRVGKTSILLRYVEGAYEEGRKSTLQASYLDKRIVLPPKRGGGHGGNGGGGGGKDDGHHSGRSNGGGVAADLSIWDTAGQERFHSLGPIYYRDADGAVVVYDITDAQSFVRVKAWTRELRKMVGDDIVIAIVGNKSDLERDRVVDEDEVLAYADGVGATHFAASAKLGTGLDDVFEDMTRKMMVESSRRRRRALGTAAGAGFGGSAGGGQKLIVLSDEEEPTPQSSSYCC